MGTAGPSRSLHPGRDEKRGEPFVPAMSARRSKNGPRTEAFGKWRDLGPSPLYRAHPPPQSYNEVLWPRKISPWNIPATC